MHLQPNNLVLTLNQCHLTQVHVVLYLLLGCVIYVHRTLDTIPPLVLEGRGTIVTATKTLKQEWDHRINEFQVRSNKINERLSLPY